MMRHRTFLLVTIAACVVFPACGEQAVRDRAESAAGGMDRPADTATSRATTGAQDSARQVVEEFGTRMRRVSVLGPDSSVSRELREAYGALVNPELLARWEARPDRAPGRRVSSPWPQRIRVDSVASQSPDTVMLVGTVLYASSADSTRADATSERVALRVARGSDGAWRITDFTDRTPRPR